MRKKKQDADEVEQMMAMMAEGVASQQRIADATDRTPDLRIHSLAYAINARLDPAEPDERIVERARVFLHYLMGGE